MKRIILDTNFLMLPFTKKIDIFSELDRIVNDRYEACVVEGTICELNKIIEEQRGKDKDAAKMALQLAKAKKIGVLKQKDLNRNAYSKDHVVDDIILENSDGNTIVATQDKLLKQKLKNKGIKVMYLKNRILEIKDVL